jgi:tetratricopeptide (TPR) repeat protein
VAGAAGAADGAIAAAEAWVARDPASAAAYVALAVALTHEAGVSGDGSYHARAEAALARARAIEPSHYGALRTRAWVLLGAHDFRAAAIAAEAARTQQPDDWWNYATLADAYVELGRYTEAAEAVQRLADLRPGLPAYARIAFLRGLHGDRPGAIAALRRAVAAAGDAASLAWALVHLGHEHFAAGALAAAGAAHERALGVLPAYPPALAGLARVRAAQGRLDDAIALYRRAADAMPTPEVVAALGDALAVRGEGEEAERQYALVDHMARVATATGTTYGRQLALFYADHERAPAEAVRLARAEAATRDDVYTADALAWALCKAGRPRRAKRAAQRALRLGTPDAALHYHAGVIAAALGRAQRGRWHLRRALALNPYFDLRQAPLARASLAALEAPTDVALR